jgi:hypothetical protein
MSNVFEPHVFDPDCYAHCPRCGTDVHLSGPMKVGRETQIILKCPKHDDFEVAAGRLSKENPQKKPGKLTGQYAQMVEAPTTHFGKLSYPEVDYGTVRYVLDYDERLHGKHGPSVWVEEGGFELCDRRSGEEVRKVMSVPSPS